VGQTFLRLRKNELVLIGWVCGADFNGADGPEVLHSGVVGLPGKG